MRACWVTWWLEYRKARLFNSRSGLLGRWLRHAINMGKAWETHRFKWSEGCSLCFAMEHQAVFQCYLWFVTYSFGRKQSRGERISGSPASELCRCLVRSWRQCPCCWKARGQGCQVVVFRIAWQPASGAPGLYLSVSSASQIFFFKVLGFKAATQKGSNWNSWMWGWENGCWGSMATTAHSFDPKLPGCQSGSAESVSHCRHVNLLFFFSFFPLK